MSLGTALRGPIAQILRQFGEDATYRRVTTHHDVAQGRVVEDHTDTAVKVVREQFAAHLVDGTAIKATDCKLIVAASALTLTPTAGESGANDTQVYDVVIVAGTTYRVHRAEPVGSNGTQVVWTIHGRR